MLTCPHCRADVPEGMRFCLQCGASLAPPAPPPAPYEWADPQEAPLDAPAPLAELPPPAPVTASPRPLPQVAPAVPVKTPRAGAGAYYARPSLGDPMLEIDDELLKASFSPPPPPPGAVACRFCKGPLDLAGEFCEQCGAPVEEAAPPGVLKAPPAAPPDPPPPQPGQAAPLDANASAYYPNDASPPSAEPGAYAEPTYPTPAPDSPTSPPSPPTEENPSGFLGRFKGLFKKG